MGPVIGVDSKDRPVHSISVGEFALGISSNPTYVHMGPARQAFLGMDVYQVGCVESLVGHRPALNMLGECGSGADGPCDDLDLKDRCTGISKHRSSSRWKGSGWKSDRLACEK